MGDAYIPEQSTIARRRALMAAGLLEDFDERAAIMTYDAADEWPTRQRAEAAALEDVEYRNGMRKERKLTRE